MLEETKTTKRLIPQSELDYTKLITDSVWGKNEIAPELTDTLQKYFSQDIETLDSKGKKVIQKQVTSSSLWGLFSYYTRDLRLANLNPEEMDYCCIYLDFAGDCLRMGFIVPFLTALSRVATRLELSQSKKGFLRRNLKTETLESVNENREPQKKSLFGGIGKKRD